MDGVGWVCARGSCRLSGPHSPGAGPARRRVSGGTGLHVLGSGEHRPHFGHEILHGETHGVPVASHSDPHADRRSRSAPDCVGGKARHGDPAALQGQGPLVGARWGCRGKTGPLKEGALPLYLSYFALHRGHNCRGDLAVFFLRNSPNVSKERSHA